MKYKFIYISAFLLCCLALFLSKESATEKILRSQSIWDLGHYRQDNLFPDFLDELESNPDDQTKWEALYHYRSFNDGAVALLYYYNCFDLFFDKAPLILYHQYAKTGDKRILDSVRNTIIWADSFGASNRTVYKKEKIISTLQAIKKAKPSSDRELLLFQTMDSCRNIDALESNPDDQIEWETLYRYGSLTEGGLALYYYCNCFDLFFIKEPLLLYHQYAKTGDKRILDLVKNTIKRFDPLSFRYEGYSTKYKKEKIISTLQAIKKAKPSSDRELLFFQTMDSCHKAKP